MEQTTRRRSRGEAALVPVYRVVEVLGNMPLTGLRDVICSAMGWAGAPYHLSQFHVTLPNGSKYYYLDEPDEEEVDMAELYAVLGPAAAHMMMAHMQQPTQKSWEGVRVSDVLLPYGGEVAFEYDFGDGWMHDVTLEDVSDRPATVAAAAFPRLLEGEGLCPAEDSGGIYGWLAKVQAINGEEADEEELAWVKRALRDQGVSTQAGADKAVHAILLGKGLQAGREIINPAAFDVKEARRRVRRGRAEAEGAGAGAGTGPGAGAPR